MTTQRDLLDDYRQPTAMSAAGAAAPRFADLLAALNKMEMLPWDVWGAQPQPDESLDEERLAFFDRLACTARNRTRRSTSSASSTTATIACACRRKSSTR